MPDSQKAKRFSIGPLVDSSQVCNVFPIKDGTETIAFAMNREAAWMVRDGLNAAVEEGCDVSPPFNLEHLVGRKCIHQNHIDSDNPTIGTITGGSGQQVFVNWGKDPQVAYLDCLLIEGEDFTLKTTAVRL